MAWPAALLGAGLGWRLLSGLLNGLRVLMLSRTGLFIVTAAAWLGINLGTVNLVIQPAVAQLQAFAQGGAGGGGGELYELAKNWMGVLQFDKALTMILSAIGTRAIITKGRLFLFKRGVGA